MGGATRFLLLLTSPLALVHPAPSSLYRLGRHSRFSSTLYLHHHFTLSPRTQSLQHLTTIKSSQRIHTQASNSFKEDHYSLGASHPWPEWSKLVHNLSPAAEVHGIFPEDVFVSYEYLSDEFVRSATACLAFARNRPDILGLLSRKDIEVVVENGTPFLFESALDTGRRMRSFLGSTRINVLESDKAHTVDLMKYLLSYASNPTVSSERNNLYNRELIESSVRNLLSELAEVSCRVPVANLSAPEQHQVSSRYGETPRPLGQNIEMKRGDWICPRCSFMNFARNVKCLECEQPRPKRQLTGGEWECPQCDFFNYGRNTACLRCDCKRPGEASFDTVSSRSGLGYNNGDYSNKSDVDSRLAVNEEKAQRWFSKVSQLDNASDLSNAAADEDFPEIMPLRKGINRFVVSTRKTPLERRMASSQYQRNLANDGPRAGIDSQTGGANKNLDSSVGRSLDQILGSTSTFPETDNRSISGQDTGTVKLSAARSGSLQYRPPKGSNSGYVPFVPLPTDMFAKRPQSSNMEDSEKMVTERSESVSSKANDQRGPVSLRDENGKSGENFQLSENAETEVDSKNKEKVQAEKSERWFKRVAELHDVPDLASAISDEDFPKIMPMPKGENRFVISKKKDRYLTSPMYKRQMPMEQANNTKFVPFVPFPPDYFAKKDKPQPKNTDPTVKSADEAYSISRSLGMNPVKSDDARRGEANLNQEATTENQQTSRGNWSSHYSVNVGAPISGNQTQNSPGSRAISNDSWSSRYSGKDNISHTGPTSVGNPSKTTFSSQSSTNESWSSTYSGKENASQLGTPSSGNPTQNNFSFQPTSNLAGNTTQPPESQNVKSGWTGKSLEGSAVKEPNPLDMSEEAKAERWFRRVAQIKDISDLSQIPDEDFPSIMPMRKGVNRFVVSKRKTPLERRLTSPQYRRNLPTVSSDPRKKDSDSS